jgi:hypothetical protein
MAQKSRKTPWFSLPPRFWDGVHTEEIGPEECLHASKVIL